jgi:hypothetical protein
MASTLKGSIHFRITGNEVISNGPLRGSNKHEMELMLDLPTGTADGNINLVYSTIYTGIGSGVTTLLDLSGSVSDISGATIAFAEVVTIAVRNLSDTDTNYIAMGPDATNGFGVVASNRGFWADASDRVIINGDFDAQSNDGGWVILHARGGVAVSAGSTDELAFVTAGSASGATWAVVILGRS